MTRSLPPLCGFILQTYDFLSLSFRIKELHHLDNLHAYAFIYLFFWQEARSSLDSFLLASSCSVPTPCRCAAVSLLITLCIVWLFVVCCFGWSVIGRTSMLRRSLNKFLMPANKPFQRASVMLLPPRGSVWRAPNAASLIVGIRRSSFRLWFENHRDANVLVTDLWPFSSCGKQKWSLCLSGSVGPLGVWVRF